MRNPLRHGTGLLVCGLLAGLVGAAVPGRAHAAKTSADVVKASAKASKPDADGKQTVTITLEITDKKFHIYANPTKNDIVAGAATTVAVKANVKPEDVKIDYPAGKLYKDKSGEKYMIYDGTATIKVHVRRAKGDTSPLELKVTVNACDDSKCLVPGIIKLAAP